MVLNEEQLTQEIQFLCDNQYIQTQIAAALDDNIQSLGKHDLLWYINMHGISIELVLFFGSEFSYKHC